MTSEDLGERMKTPKRWGCGLGCSSLALKKAIEGKGSQSEERGKSLKWCKFQLCHEKNHLRDINKGLLGVWEPEEAGGQKSSVAHDA